MWGTQSEPYGVRDVGPMGPGGSRSHGNRTGGSHGFVGSGSHGIGGSGSHGVGNMGPMGFRILVPWDWRPEPYRVGDLNPMGLETRAHGIGDVGP